MTITFIGHSQVEERDRVKEAVKNHVRNSIINSESVTCYVGGYGDFDNICASVCMELKTDIPCIEVVYVMPYITLSHQEKFKEMQRLGLCDSSVYPPIERTPPRLAISKRNEWMIANSELVIGYVRHNYGGAYNSLKFATKHKKKIINIGDKF